MNNLTAQAKCSLFPSSGHGLLTRLGRLVHINCLLVTIPTRLQTRLNRLRRLLATTRQHKPNSIRTNTPQLPDDNLQIEPEGLVADI